MRKRTSRGEIYTSQMIGAKRIQNIPPLIFERTQMEVLNPHASLNYPSALNETPLNITRLQRPTPNRNQTTTTPKQVIPILLIPEGITWY